MECKENRKTKKKNLLKKKKRREFYESLNKEIEEKQVIRKTN